MPPEEDARLLLFLASRHERSLHLAMDEAFPQEDWGFLAQQAVETLLKALIVLSDRLAPLSRDLRLLEREAGIVLPGELLELEEFAVKARYSPDATPLPASRTVLLDAIGNLHREVEAAIAAADQGPSQGPSSAGAD
jgi:HEPN domain-containing protein